MKKIPIVVIAGPTASGKTALAVEIAKRINGEIISADSVQVYKYLNIGSAKPTAEEMCGIAHHLMDCIDPNEMFSAADFAKRAHECAADIVSRGKIPILAGGTGLYIDTVINDVDFEEENSAEAARVRSELWQTAREKGADYMMDILQNIDPEAAANIHKNNLVRVIRAIEFYRVTGVKISEHQKKTKEKESRYSPCMLLIEHDRDKLYERINKRVDIMMESGLVEEVRSLMKMGYTKSLNSMKGIGYKEVMLYLRGFLTYSELCEVLKRMTRRYAKRQITWFKKDDRYIPLKFTGKIADEAEKIIEIFMQNQYIL